MGETNANEERTDSSLESMLIFTLVNQNPNLHNICVNKPVFKVGRSNECDHCIQDVLVSRHQCIISYDFPKEQWMIQDLSSCGTFVNGTQLKKDSPTMIKAEDVIRFNICDEFKYLVSEVMLVDKERARRKRQLNQELLDEEIKRQKLIAEEQEKQKKEIEQQLEAKQKEQEELRNNLEKILEKHRAAEGKTEEMSEIIKNLENKLNTGSILETQLRDNYNQLLTTFTTQNDKFEEKINEERRKWQETLEMTKQEKEAREKQMIEELAKWREQQTAHWNATVHELLKREKENHNELARKYAALEEDLKQHKVALQEKTALAEQLQKRPVPVILVKAPRAITNKINLKNPTDTNSGLPTIDLTAEGTSSSNNSDFNKLKDVMTDQLACPICHELFIVPIAVNCGHTFCQHCIYSWVNKKNDCPNCRTAIVTLTKQISLENFIEQAVQDLSVENKERRKELQAERKKLNVQIKRNFKVVHKQQATNVRR